MRHLFGVSEAEVWDWPMDQYDRYRAFCDTWLEANNMTMKG